jgi:hypothetical protein
LGGSGCEFAEAGQGEFASAQMFVPRTSINSESTFFSAAEIPMLWASSSGSASSFVVNIAGNALFSMTPRTANARFHVF